MTQFHAGPHHVFAAAHGSPGAQRDLAASLLWHAEAVAVEDQCRADEYLACAEMMAELAFAHRDALSIATLAAVVAVRSLHCDLDPVRGVEWREQAERLFGLVEEQGDDTKALATIGVALNRLADADPSDDRAILRLGRIVDALPAGEACLLREMARPAPCEPVTTRGE